MTIPRVIHYCWFGGADLPALEQSCMSTWPKVLPEYEIRRWDESCVDLQSVRYLSQAYERGRYAFVADVVRLQALYEHGGIYLDTDVELLRSFDDLLGAPAFVGFENRSNVGTAVIGAEPGNEVVGKFLEYYHTHDFVDVGGLEDTTTNVKVLQSILVGDYGLHASNARQDLGPIVVLPRVTFYPPRLTRETWDVDSETRAVHHMSGSWLSSRERRRGNSRLWRDVFRPMLRRARLVVFALLGDQRARRLEAVIRRALR